MGEFTCQDGIPLVLTTAATFAQHLVQGNPTRRTTAHPPAAPGPRSPSISGSPPASPPFSREPVESKRRSQNENSWGSLGGREREREGRGGEGRGGGVSRETSRKTRYVRGRLKKRKRHAPMAKNNKATDFRTPEGITGRGVASPASLGPG